MISKRLLALSLVALSAASCQFVSGINSIVGVDDAGNAPIDERDVEAGDRQDAGASDAPDSMKDATNEKDSRATDAPTEPDSSDPLAIPTSGLDIWFRSDQQSVEVSDGKIQRWINQSGNGNDGFPGARDGHPAFQNRQDAGLPSASFDRSNNDCIQLKNKDMFADLRRGMSAFMVVNLRPSVQYARLFELVPVPSPDNLTQDGIFFAMRSTEKPDSVFLEVWPNQGEVKGVIAPVVTYHEWHRYAVVIGAGVSGNWVSGEIYLDGQLVGKNASVAPAMRSRPSSVLGCGRTTGQTTDMNVAEFILYSRAVDKAEFATIDAYLVRKSK